MPNEPEHVVVGEITSPFGVRGAVRVWPTTDFPERLTTLRRIWLDRVDGPGWDVVELVWSGRTAVLQLAAVATREQAEALRGRSVVVPRASLPALPADTYYWHQLLHLAVVDDESGRSIGRVAHVHRRGGAHDFLEVERLDGPAFWVPVVRPIVAAVDLDAGTIRVSLPEGLEELD